MNEHDECECKEWYCYTCCPPDTQEEKDKRTRHHIEQDFKQGFTYAQKATIRFADGRESSFTFLSPHLAQTPDGTKYTRQAVFIQKIRLNPDIASLFKWVYARDMINIIPSGVKLLNKVPKSTAVVGGGMYHQPVILGKEHGVLSEPEVVELVAKRKKKANGRKK